MRIELKPMPAAAEGVAVGTLDGRPLVYVGRTAHVDGQPLSHGDIAEALADAVDRAASELLGGEWSKPLALVTGLNPRTCNRDRIRQWGLPAWVLVMLGQATQQYQPRALGHMMQAVSIMRMHSAPLSRGDRRSALGEAVDPEGWPLRLLDLATDWADLAKEERRKATLAREETKP